MGNIHRVIIPLAVLFTGILFQKHFPSFLKGYTPTNTQQSVRTDTFTSETLANYNGDSGKKLYMSVMGMVYDVSDSPQFYAKGSPYHYFTGKDGTRALITGNFQDESENKDHVLDLTCPDILNLQNWREKLDKKYKIIGIMAGRYYESSGWSTAYAVEFSKKIEQCLEEKKTKNKQNLKYPPCNMAWTKKEGSKVWCTKSSGGVTRDWIGVPRQVFGPGLTTPKCVCLNTKEEQDNAEKFKQYRNCANTSTVCFVDSA